MTIGKTNFTKMLKLESKQKVLSLNTLKCFITRLDDIQRLIIIHPVIMKIGFEVSPFDWTPN